MKPSDKKQEKMFNDGVATSLIDWAVANLPNIMFTVGVLLRIGIGAILLMHTLEILSFIRDPKLRYILAFIFVGSVEVFLTATSYASAGLWKASASLKKGGMVSEATSYNHWAWGFLTVTVLGSLLFNALMLAYAPSGFTEAAAQTNEATKQGSKYFVAIQKDMSWQVMMLIQTMNVMAVLASEGSAFLLNSNYSKSTVTPTDERARRETLDGNSSVTEKAREMKTKGIA